jgi:site-specific recombinase XerC
VGVVEVRLPAERKLSQQLYTQILKKWMRPGPVLPGRSLGAITSRNVERFIAGKLCEGRAAKSVRNYSGLLHAVLAFAVKRGWLDTNPCDASIFRPPAT